MAEIASAVIQPDSLSMGLITTPMLDARIPCMRLSWIAWDSGFRGSGLQIGDYIIAIDSAVLTRPADAAELQHRLPQLPGQYDECRHWKDLGANAGRRVKLHVRRRNFPGEGWRELDIEGELQPQRTWVTDSSRQLFGRGGPDRMEYDGFSESWWDWYEKAATSWQRYLDGYWQGNGFNNRFELQQILQDEPRIKLLGEKYPGAFSEAVTADWQAVRDCMLSRPYTLAADTLAYRKLDEERMQQLAQAATSARTAWLTAHQSELIPPFPAIDPILGDRAGVAGKLVELPTISQHEWISQGQRTVFVFGQSDQWYFADGSSKPIERMIHAQRRYEAGVSPNIRSDFAVVARVLPEPTLVVYNERGCFGLRVEPVAATIGDALFIDLDASKNDPPLYAGEAELAAQALSPPPDNAPPRTVMECFHTALKLGDQKLWQSLFADWSLHFADNGLPLIDRGCNPDVDSWWDSARRLILGEVLDVRVAWTDDTYPVVVGREFDNAPKIDETHVEVDHIGQEADGTTRTFSKVGLQRVWTLQRVDGGPWRIVSMGGI
jgi:hypothetical protein